MISRKKVVSELSRLGKLYKDYQASGLNETETCEYVINGLLNALGWDITDPGIGRHEHRIQTADSDIYADYSFFDRRYEPNERSTARVRVFVEAKRVSRNLGVDAQGRCQDKQTKAWLEQVAFYGVLRGARWLVLTNGHQMALFRPSQDGDSLYAQGQLVFQSFEDMLARVDDLLLLSRESVWSEHIDQSLGEQQATRYQIPTPRTRVRALFEANDLQVFFDDKAVDFAIADHQVSVTPDPLFYQGVNASWENILANQDVVRPKLIEEIFRAYYFNSNVCIIRSESGQGKTTLMFRFAYEYRDLFYVLELRHLTLSNVRFCELGVRNLTGLHKPILVLIDDVTRKQGWKSFLHAVTSMRHVYILATTREDEWVQTDVRGMESRIAYISPKLDYETASLIYDGITSKGFRKTGDSLWKVYSQSRGRLLEFVTLITQGGHLEAILDVQVSSLATRGTGLLSVLRFVSFFHALGLSVDIDTLEAAIGDITRLDLLHMLDQLSGEFVSRMPDGTYEGLHELRSRIITDILHKRFFAFNDTLTTLLECARMDQFETLIKNLPLLGEDIWDQPGVEKLIGRLRTVDDPTTLIQCIRAFNEPARHTLSSQISKLSQLVVNSLVELDPDQFILALHRAFMSSFKWRYSSTMTGIDHMILAQIPTTILVSKLSQALPVSEYEDCKEWTDYAQLVEWAEVVGAVSRTIGVQVIDDIVQFVGESEFSAFASLQEDVLGVLGLLEVFGEHLQPYIVGEIVGAWLSLDWEYTIGRLQWDEQKHIIERLVALEDGLWLVSWPDTNWRDLVLEPLAYSLVGWDPPDATLDLLDEAETIDEGLAENLREHPEVSAELDRIEEWRSEQESSHTVRDFQKYDVDELVTLSPKDIANRLVGTLSSVAVQLLKALEARTPEKLRPTMTAIGEDLISIGQTCKSLEEIEDFVFVVSRGSRATLNEVCQAMKIHDSDLVLERARLRRETEEEKG